MIYQIRKNLIKLLQSKIFIPFFVFHTLRKIYLLEKVLLEKDEYPIVILILNYKRWEKDVDLINKDPRVKVLILPESLQSLFGRIFYAPLIGKIKNGEWWRSEYKAQLTKIHQKYTDYLESFLFILRLFIRFDVISSCSFYYLQDQSWQEVCNKINDLHFICMHKENQKDDAILDKMVNEYKRKGIKYKGNKIFVYNRKEKECLIRGGVCSPNQITITGCIRMDNLIEKSFSYEYKVKNNAITLFSFRHAFGGMRFKNDDDGGFSLTRKNGCVELFENVHGYIAQFAIENPSIPVYIKIKWDAKWYGYVENAIKKKTGKLVNQIPNLYVGSDIDPQKLIDISRIIIGINSTALLESRILGKEVLIPLFDELELKYYNNVYFRKYFDKEFNLIREKNKFLENVTFLYGKTFNLRPVGYEIVEEFLGYYDSKSKERVISEILKTIDKK